MVHLHKAIEKMPSPNPAPSDKSAGVTQYFEMAQNANAKQQPEEAIRILKRSLQQWPEHGPSLQALGELCVAQERFTEALHYLERAETVCSDTAELYFCKGISLDQLGYCDRAINQFAKAAQLAPDWEQAWYNLGCSLLRSGRHKEAVKAFEKTVALCPDWKPAWNNLGQALIADDQPEKALACWQKVIALDPADAVAHSNCGVYYQDMGKMKMALEAHRKALACSPDAPLILLNMGNFLKARGHCKAALEYYKKALSIDPNHEKTWGHLADTFLEMDQTAQAISAYQRKLALTPDDHATHHRLAIALYRANQIAPAMDHCRRAQRIQMDFGKATASLISLAMHGCDWSTVEHFSPVLAKDTAAKIAVGDRPDEDPFGHLQRYADPEANLSVARAWSRAAIKSLERFASAPAFSHPPRSTGNRIRIGYLSADFKNHAMAHHILGLLREHDRKRLEIYGYAANPDDGSKYRSAIAGACDHFRLVYGLNDRQAAELIYQDRIDILVDLGGHTQGNRMPVMAQRPAPIIVGYLGFLGTTGADFIDYFISDKVVTPPEHAPFYTEKLVYLPHCYQVNDNQLPIADKFFERKSMGLPENGFVFCSFNRPGKISRATFDAWMHILKQVPDSVLWLYDRYTTANENLRKAASEQGVDPNRLVFSGGLALDQHLARLKLADLALDTFTYNGGATTSNALWAGVPLVALIGTHLVSRMAASALIAVGLDALVAKTPDEYCHIAVDLALNPGRLKKFRDLLAINRDRYPLFNTPMFTRHMEQAFQMMYDRFNEGRPPVPFSVPALDDPVTPLREPNAEVVNDADLAALSRTAESLIESGKLHEATDIYLKIAEQTHDHAPVHHMLALLYQEQSQWESALQYAARAAASHPDNAHYRRTWADMLQQQGDLEGAITAYQEALSLAPEDVQALINLGNAHYRKADAQQAERCYRKALVVSPQNAIVANNLGLLSCDRGCIGEALTWYNNSLAMDPDYAEARLNRSLALLAVGEYERGFAEYEWRFQSKSAAKPYPHHLNGLRWQGSPFRGKRLLVHCEQGLGDAIQFVRFLPQVKALGGTVILEAPERLLSLFKSLTSVDQLVPFSHASPPTVPYDLHTPLLSLPWILGITAQNIPAPPCYLLADGTKSARWREKIAQDRFNIGLVWSCRDNRTQRDVPLTTFEMLFALDGTHFYGLQIGPGVEQLQSLPNEMCITSLESDQHDFSDTAAIIANLDLVISVDTSVAHLAGAMGVPVWILLPFSADWRWMMERGDSPWYSSARLFRQRIPGNWTDVMEKVLSALVQFVSGCLT